MTDRMTLLDIARQTDPDGKPAQIIEVLNQSNPILQDAPAYAANAPMGNRVTVRSSLPVVDFTRVNQGVVRSKGATAQRVDTIGMIAGLSEVDVKMKRVIGEAKFNAYRWNEDQGFLEAMSQLVAKTLIYGDERTNEASFTGLAPRLASLNLTDITKAAVFSYGTVVGGDGTSLYVVDWGERAAHLIYPEASTAGIESKDLGEIRVTDVDSNPFMAAVTSYDWSVGLTVKDNRHIARLANVDISAAQADTGFALGKALIDVLTQMPEAGGAQRVIYTHRRIVAAWYKQALDKSNAALSIRDYLGKPTAHFWEIPIRSLDQMSGAESTVS